MKDDDRKIKIFMLMKVLLGQKKEESEMEIRGFCNLQQPE